MAEILSNQHRQKTGVPKAKKASLRVDLTPMVDLGFLLISFFVLTNTISQPKAMKLAMPDDRDIIDSSVVPADKTLNLLLDADNKVYVYNGKEINNIRNTGSRTAIRAVISKKKSELRNKYGNDSGMVVLIKPTINSTYADVINALDEMLICDIKTYMLVDANAAELKAIEQ
jgi:biopolymer transport protein ExbD